MYLPFSFIQSCTFHPVTVELVPTSSVLYVILHSLTRHLQYCLIQCQCQEHFIYFVQIVNFYFKFYFIFTGFQGPDCPIDFFKRKKYRLFILAIFGIPLIIMFSMYSRIFFIIRESHYCRSRGQFYSTSSDNSTFNSSIRTNIIPLQSKSRISRLPSDHQSTIVELPPSSTNNNSHVELSSSKSKSLDRSVPSTKIFNPNASIEGDSVALDGCNISTRTSSESARRNFRSNNSTSSQRKTICTTLSIVGTYLFFYMPSVIFLALTCNDGCPFPLDSNPENVNFIFSLIVNFLIVSKAVIDPFIYLFRVKEVKEGVERLFLCSRR